MKWIEFDGILLDNLNRSWAAVLDGGWRATLACQSFWMPPHCILKFNFDGSYQQSLRRGRIGGVIRDSFGNVVRRFCGPGDALDANEAEMYALLIGCQQLLKLDGFAAIFEGDSFSALQWGSRKISYPWRLAYWVEEVQHISSQTRSSFHHNFREANENG
eukprot:TRINITY_DN9561_c0_g1_i1.p2 TRINITY_DN9561_c0_g1~~TRINITY_DN9561_c0_g1_i1.p2  ORF type:complete len:160 (-),score=26.36 TRINITY_DN9561_c0_g1_i1:1098-1577(-)